MIWNAVCFCSAVASESLAARTLTMPRSLSAIGLPSCRTTFVLLSVAKVSVVPLRVFDSKFELLTVIEIEPFVVFVAARVDQGRLRHAETPLDTASCTASALT